MVTLIQAQKWIPDCTLVKTPKYTQTHPRPDETAHDSSNRPEIGHSPIIRAENIDTASDLPLFFKPIPSEHKRTSFSLSQVLAYFFSKIPPSRLEHIKNKYHLRL